MGFHQAKNVLLKHVSSTLIPFIRIRGLVAGLLNAYILMHGSWVHMRKMGSCVDTNGLCIDRPNFIRLSLEQSVHVRNMIRECLLGHVYVYFAEC